MMPEYRFWQTYSDATPYSTPTLVKINAESYRVAVKLFCKQYRMRVLDISDDEVWVEDEHGAMMQYSVVRE